ncbi:NAD(P)/FAD-dependent oxidoreductase [Arvimicrobium flavum]|uniref:NAD(P)/FAD-dependent oxidoreductase n=1 Tax=Arvimicrobium flavum TaxID=3393320 RepID=UPI00237C48FF|nr:FAD-dependent oxidoreductase [Mesorhizobium shangrilense]
MGAGMVIVGAGECGARAALALREHGYVGPVTLLGAESHAPYERPPLSKDAITDEDEPQPKHVALAERFAEQRIDLLTARHAIAIDREAQVLRLSDGSAIAYDKLLLATGAMARRLPMAEAAGERCLTLRTFDDAVRIRGLLGPGVRVAIVGGGFIGLELAASARARGAEAVIIEAQPRVLMRGVPEALAAVIVDRHGEAGAELICGQGISSIAEETAGVVIELEGGRRIEADFAVIGIGAQPATQLAAEAGLEIDNGIAVDGLLRTSDENIFAAGDCCSFPLEIYGGRRVRLESWRNAQDQGEHAARSMLGGTEPFGVVPWFWSDQYDLTLQIAGLAEGATEVVRRDLGDGAFILFHLADDGRLIAASGIGRGNAVARDIRLAEMLIARGVKPDPADLASANVKLKGLLKA